MELTREEILKLAKSARLKFNDEELSKIEEDLKNILDYMSILNEVDTDNVEPLIYINETVKELREDIVKESLDVKDVIKNAPASEEGAIIVPKVVGE